MSERRSAARLSLFRLVEIGSYSFSRDDSSDDERLIFLHEQTFLGKIAREPA